MCLFATVLCAAGARAEEEALRWYQVEFIVFQHLNERAVDSEKWPLDVPMTDLAGSIEPRRAAMPGAGLPQAQETLSAGPVAFQLLGEGEFSLGEAYRMFRRSPYYRPLLHMAWRQPGFDRGEAPAVHVSRLPLPLELFTSPIDPAARRPDEARADREAAVDGVLRVYLSRYLHVEADLVLTLPTPEQAPGTMPVFNEELGLFEKELETKPYRFRLAESRRMRSGELHYLDHPLFGLLVRVDRYEPPAPPAAEPTPGTSPGKTPAGGA